MLRYVFAGLIALAPLGARAQTEQQQVVDRASLAAQDLLNDRDGKDAQYVLRRARAVMICPQIFRAGFLLGGQGGTCVLTARDGAGSWSAPAFYGFGGASVGFQAGVQDAEVMFLIMNDKALRAVMDSQLKLGADAAITFVDVGGGVEGATTTALRADIVGFSRARGLFAGISLGGSMMSAKSDWNEAYYGRPMGVQNIVLTMEARNPGADPLREVLSRYGTQVASGSPPPPVAGPGPIQLMPEQRGPVQQQRLAPIDRQPLGAPRRY
ncbi:MAG TPA: lipid-binding SYLF domain-containing protein [Acetobacteraceae bacterium]|nr:lipid-binding SYLF domain-containing protein [Acetobacteraceae bacterium]